MALDAPTRWMEDSDVERATAERAIAERRRELVSGALPCGGELDAPRSFEEGARAAACLLVEAQRRWRSLSDGKAKEERREWNILGGAWGRDRRAASRAWRHADRRRARRRRAPRAAGSCG